jgi:hypothetical protein
MRPARRSALFAIVLGLAALGCATAAPPPDEGCLAQLRARGIAFREGPSLRGVRTPVTLDGDRFSPRLTPRAGRPAEMDCRLAVALADARPIFNRLGISQLEYSGAYEYRNRRHSDQLSAHAAGLAIDVHAFHDGGHDYEVARTFERHGGRWRRLAFEPGWYRDCVGRPRTRGALLLRRLGCRLHVDDDFRIILTPDDNRDHHDHFHLEARAAID